jgi:hypothetical protein
MPDLAPAAVAARLAALAATWRPLRADEARALLAAPPREETFDAAAARRLRELHALLELTKRLRRVRP